MGTDLSPETRHLRETKALGPLWRAGFVADAQRGVETLLRDLENELWPGGIDVVPIAPHGVLDPPAIDLVIADGTGVELRAAELAVRERVPLLRLRDRSVPRGLLKLLSTARVAEFPLLELTIGESRTAVLSSIELRNAGEEVVLESRRGTRFPLAGRGVISLPSPLSTVSGQRATAARTVVVSQGDPGIGLEVPVDELPLSLVTSSAVRLRLSQTGERWLGSDGIAVTIGLADQRLGVLVSAGVSSKLARDGAVPR